LLPKGGKNVNRNLNECEQGNIFLNIATQWQW